MSRALKTSITILGLLGCTAAPEKPMVLGRIDSVVTPQPAQPAHFDSAILARARQSIEDYLHANVASSRGMMNIGSGPEDVPQMEQCAHNFTLKSGGSLIAVARARVLEAQPVGMSGGRRGDTVSVLAELLVIARAYEGDTVWNVEPDVHVDSVRFTLLSTERRNVWSLCWAGFEAPDSPRQPLFFNYTDSFDVGYVRWKPPLKSWASLKKLADSVRWSSLHDLEKDSAVTHAIATGNFSNRLGVLEHTRAGGDCITIADSTLPPGTPILVIAPDNPKSASRGAIEARRARECMRAGDEWGSVVMSNASFYDVVFPPGVAGADEGIVIAARPSALHETNGAPVIDIDADGHPESFTSCHSSEGTHLIVSTRDGENNKKLWEAYVYVPYDLEPDCSQ